MVVTKAGEALRVALDPTNPNRAMTQAELARRLKVKQPSVSEWVRMNTRPESHYRQAIQRELGILADDWMTDTEREIAVGDGSGEHRLIANDRDGTDG